VDLRRQNLLLGKIRHNLKTHVNVIVGYSDLLLEIAEEENLSLQKIASEVLEIRESGHSILQDINKVFMLKSRLEGNIFEHIRTIADKFEHDVHETLEFISKKVELFLSHGFIKLNQECIEDFQKIRYSTVQLHSIIHCLIEIKVDRIEDLIDSGILTKADCDLIDSFSSSLHVLPELLKSKFPSTILVIDDNASNTDYLKRKLEATRHTVMSANSTKEAEELIVHENVDLVLLDILMPDVNGYEFLKRHANDFQKNNVPVIMVSSLDETDAIYRCLEAGAEDYVTKPYNFITLNARINSSLERKFLKDKEKGYLKTIEEEQRKSENLLLNILPAPIAERLKAHEVTIADSFTECSVLFADIVGFTPLSAKLGAKQLVDLLNEIFTAFDEFTEDLGLEKIKTIGDSYMVAAGIPEPHPDHAKVMVKMAENMLRYFENMDEIEGETISIRIGIHSGPVVAGVIGKKKFIYDLWGDTVNTAARMESHGVAGSIHVSKETAELIGDRYHLNSRGVSEIKGKGPMETYLVTL
jgi:adenylate cyclase